MRHSARKRTLVLISSDRASLFANFIDIHVYRTATNASLVIFSVFSRFRRLGRRLNQLHEYNTVTTHCNVICRLAEIAF